ncbi:MAG: NAD-dependent epimerase/dehydratase family protein [Pseudomonadota bacterium]
MSETVLVTGADGFVGRHLVRLLAEKGNVVIALDRGFRKAPANWPRARVEPVEADIMNGPAIEAIMEGVDTVYHLAAYTGLWARDKRVYHAVNVEGTHLVLKAAIKNRVRRFVYCSSFVTLISGRRKIVRPVDETARPDPSHLFGDYAQSKARAEELVLRASSEIEAVVVMPSAPLGPGDHNLTAPTALVRDLANGNIPATIKQFINFVDVRELVRGIASAAEKGKSGERYLLAGENIPMQTFLEKMEEATGLPMPKRRISWRIAAFATLLEEMFVSRFTGRPPKGPHAGVLMAGRRLIFKADKAESELDFAVKPIDHALHATLLWLQKYGHLKRSVPRLEEALKKAEGKANNPVQKPA